MIDANIMLKECCTGSLLNVAAVSSCCTEYMVIAIVKTFTV